MSSSLLRDKGELLGAVRTALSRTRQRPRDPGAGAVLRCEGVTVRFGGIVALSDVDLSVDAGEVLAVVGALGAGKSTLLRAAAGVLTPQAGRVLSQGADVAQLPPGEAARRGIALVPAVGGIFPTLTVRQNLELAERRPQRFPSPAVQQLVSRFPILGARPAQLAGSLSGGEQRQLALARAALGEPRVLLLDEPLLGLAPQVSSAVAALVRDLAAAGSAVLVAEERPTAVVRSLATRLVGLQLGRIVDAPDADGAREALAAARFEARPHQRIELQAVRVPLTVAEKRALQTRATERGETVGELLAQLARDHVMSGAGAPLQEG
ncbi:MAG: ATP-binding cassette domain-containing protein [Candidatus Dormibacteria bacterium]